MSVWLSETEFRQSGAAAAGLTINVAFLQEIKEDTDLKTVIANTREHFQTAESNVKRRPIDTARILHSLRDELQTYFALEEFYGYFQNAQLANPAVSHKADLLRNEHETLILEVNEIIDMIEQIVYHESSPELTFECVAEEVDHFLMTLQEHEDKEMELVMRLFNEELGVGD